MWLSCLVIPLQAALALADEGSVKKGPTRKEVAKAGKGEEGGEQEEGVEDELKGEEEEELYKDLMQQLFEEEEDRDGLEEEGKGKRPRRPRAEGEAEAEAEAEVEVEVEPEQRERRPAQRKARKRRRIEQDDDEDEEAEEEKKRERVKSRGEEEDDMEQYIRSEEEVAKLSRVWHEVHRGYFEEQARKQDAASRQKQEKPENDAGGTGIRRRGGGKRGVKGSRKGMAGATGDAVSSHLAKRRVSKKINYEAVKMLGVEEDEEALPPELTAMLEAGEAGREGEEVELSGLGNPQEEGSVADDRGTRSKTLQAIREEEEEEEEEEEGEEARLLGLVDGEEEEGEGGVYSGEEYA